MVCFLFLPLKKKNLLVPDTWISKFSKTRKERCFIGSLMRHMLITKSSSNCRLHFIQWRETRNRASCWGKQYRSIPWSSHRLCLEMVRAHVNLCLWTPGVSMSVFLDCPLQCELKQGLLLNAELLDSECEISQLALGIYCLWFPNTEIAGGHKVCQAFMLVLGIQMPVFMLAG